MRGLEEGKGKLLRRENNNHMLINFSLQMHRKYTNQLRVHKPKRTALIGLLEGQGVIIWEVSDYYYYYYFPEEEWPQPCQGKEILSPLLPSTRSLPPLFQLSLWVPRISCGILQ